MAKKATSKRGHKEICEEHETIIQPNLTLDFKVECKFDLIPQHVKLINTIKNANTQIVFVDGYAGTCKTFCAMFAGLTLLSKKSIDKIIYTRSIAESALFRMGSLPGEIEEKFAPWIGPMQDKLNELIPSSLGKKLINEKYIECIPVNYMRGLTFHDTFVVIDEAQNMTFNELTTILTRFGNKSKYVIIGDSHQSDINGKSGFRKIFNGFNNAESIEKGIYTFEFGEDCIVRSEILKFIVRMLENAKMT